MKDVGFSKMTQFVNSYMSSIRSESCDDNSRRMLQFEQPIEFQTVNEISPLAGKMYRLPFRMNSFSAVIIEYRGKHLYV